MSRQKPDPIPPELFSMDDMEEEEETRVRPRVSHDTPGRVRGREQEEREREREEGGFRIPQQYDNIMKSMRPGSLHIISYYAWEGET